MATMLEQAIALAVKAHAGQVDKAGEPYILHPLRVMMGCLSELERVCAVLHDVVEDTSLTLELLKAEGFSDVVLEIVDVLTRRDGEVYLDYIERVGQHPIARRIKLLDLEDNLTARRLSVSEVCAVPSSLRKRYTKARELLLGIK